MLDLVDPVGTGRRPVGRRADQPRQLVGGGLATTIGRGERAWGAGLVRRFYGAISVAPSPQRPPKSLTLAGAASFGHGTEMRLGSGASRCRLAQHGGNHGQRRQRFSAVLLYGIIRHGDCPRGREPAHLMQPLCLATLLGQ